MQSERAFHQTIVFCNRLYLVGGLRNGNPSAKIGINESIPLNKNSLNIGFGFPPMLEKRCAFGMCSFGECFIVAGGVNSTNVLKACEIFTPQSSEWIKIADMNFKKCFFTLTYFQQKVWAIGGFDSVDGESFDTIETYNLAEDKWSIIDVKLLKKRMGHSTVAYNDNIFVIGGYNKNEGTLSSVEVYSNITNQFSFVSAMKISRSFFGCCLVNSKIYAVGGTVGNGIVGNVGNGIDYIDEVEIYDIKSDKWMKGPKLPLAIAEHNCNSHVTSE